MHCPTTATLQTMTKEYAGVDNLVVTKKGGLTVMLRTGVIMLTFLFLVSLPAKLWAEHEIKNIDEIMSAKEKAIDLAFADFSKTKSVSKLAEIEKMNEDAGKSLMEWLDLANQICCIVKTPEEQQNPALIRKKLDDNYEKFTFYSKMICHSYTKILGHYAENNMKRKVQTIYEFIEKAFENSDFDQCRNEAKSWM